MVTGVRAVSGVSMLRLAAWAADPRLKWCDALLPGTRKSQKFRMHRRRRNSC